MERTITVRGTGKLKLKPDLTVINLTVKSLDRDYTAAMDEAASRLQSLTAALISAGIGEKSIKTRNFFVNTEYEGERDEHDGEIRFFAGLPDFSSREP